MRVSRRRSSWLGLRRLPSRSLWLRRPNDRRARLPRRHDRHGASPIGSFLVVHRRRGHDCRRRTFVRGSPLLRLVVVEERDGRHRSLRLLPACPFPFTPDLNVHPPLYHSPDLFQSIYPDTISAARDGNKHATMLHHHDALEGRSAYQGIWLKCWRRYERENIQSLRMAQQEIMGREEGSARWRSAEVGRREMGSQRSYAETKVVQ